LNESELLAVLTRLSAAAGVAGFEDQVVELAADYFQGYGCSVKRDRFGNLLAYKAGTAKRGKKISLALVAHVDEIGAMVTKIEDGGFLRFTAIGGLDARTLPGQAVLVHGRKMLKGVIGAKPPHLLTDQDRNKTIPIDQLYIDVGLDCETLKKKVSVGDIISFEQEPLLSINRKYISGKALDNRAGVAALIYCAAELANLKHEADLVFIASLQEEVGLRGATTAAFGLKPDLAVAIDVTHGDGPGLENEFCYKLSAGPTLARGPNIDEDIFFNLKHVAADNYLPYQVEPIPGRSGTDAWAFQVSREGIPTGLLSIPLRYMHSTVELICIDDLVVCSKILSSYARTVNYTMTRGSR
jgi:tetrahedral aminopeptidase